MYNRHVDYDRIASTYDRRYAADSMERTSVALLALAKEVGAKRILEVGCGTGRWLADLRSALPASQVCGLDFSIGMLKQAAKRPAAFGLAQGRGGRLPFAEATFDLVYCVNAIHHFDHPRAFVSAARRLLRPGGALAVFGTDPRGHRGRWYIYRYFDGTYEADLHRFPSWGAILDWMVADGFEPIEWRLVERIVDHKTGRAVLDDTFLQKGATSQLALLSEEAYAAGLRRIEAELARAEEAGEAGETSIFPVDLLFGLLVGRV